MNACTHSEALQAEILRMLSSTTAVTKHEQVTKHKQLRKSQTDGKSHGFVVLSVRLATKQWLENQTNVIVWTNLYVPKNL